MKNYTTYIIKERLKKIFEEKGFLKNEYWKFRMIEFKHVNTNMNIKFDDPEVLNNMIHVRTSLFDFALNFEKTYYDLLDSEELIRVFEFVVDVKVLPFSY